MNPRRLGALIGACLLLAGCATPPAAQTEALDYGPPPPANYQQIIKDKWGAGFKDPDSALYKFGDPFKAYTRHAPIGGGGIDKVGWMVQFQVNAKNGFGGYTGYETHQVLFVNGIMTKEVLTNPYFKEPWLHGGF